MYLVQSYFEGGLGGASLVIFFNAKLLAYTHNKLNSFDLRRFYLKLE